mgnify:CR=1 FL=1
MPHHNGCSAWHASPHTRTDWQISTEPCATPAPAFVPAGQLDLRRHRLPHCLTAGSTQGGTPTGLSSQSTNHPLAGTVVCQLPLVWPQQESGASWLIIRALHGIATGCKDEPGSYYVQCAPQVSSQQLSAPFCMMWVICMLVCHAHPLVESLAPLPTHGKWFFVGFQ